MRIPATALTQHLMWTRSGVVWATWRLNGLAYGFSTPAAKSAVLGHHQAFYQALRGEALLLGLTADLDPVTIVQRMLDGVNIAEHPEWAEEVSLTLDSLERVPLGTRAYWLAVPLAAGNWKNRAMSIGRAGITGLRDALALPPEGPSKAEISEALNAARDIEERIPAAFQPRRSTPAEQVWMALHAQHRGLAIDAAAPLPAPQQDGPKFVEQAATIGDYQLPTAMPNPWLDEGGQSDLQNGSLAFANPFKRRYLKVQSPRSEAASYQVMQALVGSPRGGWAMPGVEWMSFVDQYNLDVDWAQRLQVTRAADVRKRNARAEANLADQYQQQGGNGPSITGSESELDIAAAELAEFHLALNSSDREVEVQATIIFAVGADSAELAREKAQYIASEYKRSEFTLEAPLGGQEELWWAMQPGIPTSSICRELTQVTTGRDISSGVPLVSFELGDERGSRFGVNIGTGRMAPVLQDLHGNITSDVSASLGVIGELGCGKSTVLKAIGGDVIDRGGRLVGIDRTVSQEYATFAASLVPDSTTVVDLMRPEYSLDPFRVFGPRTGSRMVQSLFAMMLGIQPRDPRGVALSGFLEPESVAANNITSLGRLLEHLRQKQRSAGGAVVEELLGLINVIASKDLGEVLFNDRLPAMPLDSTGLFFLTSGLQLPGAAQLENEHLFKEMSLEKIYGRAMYAQLTAISREICFMDRTQLAMFLVDETHHIVESPEGEQDLQVFIRDGRKHAAVCALGSHDPADFGGEITRGLIKTRIVMRQTDEVLAQRAVDWLVGPKAARDGGLEYLVDEVTNNVSPLGPNGVDPARRGEGFMRDARGRIGKFRKTLPERASRRAAVLSTPSVPDHRKLEALR